MFKRIPHVVDVQIAWLLMTFCAATRANCWRTVPPKFTAEYARVDDNRVVQCLCDVLHIRNGLLGHTLETASLPLTLGGLGVGGGARVRDAVFWGSWADCLEMVKARHPQVAQDMMTDLRSQQSGCFSSVTGAVNRLLERLQMGCAQRTLESLSGNHDKAGDGTDTHPPPCTITTGNRWCGLTSLWQREHW